MTARSWRDVARPIIAKVLRETAGQTEKEVRSALFDAYPFGERAMHPYKIWCDEVRVQLGEKPPADQRARLATMQRHRDRLSPRKQQLLALYEAAPKHKDKP